jgi:phosphoserine aminotransferase
MERLTDMTHLGAGPAKLPPWVKARLIEAMDRFDGTRYSILEIPHRDDRVLEMLDTMRRRLRRLMQIPTTHEILFVPGGATSSYVTSILNLINPNLYGYAPRIGYNCSGYWGEEASQYGHALAEKGACKAGVLATSKSDGYRSMAAVTPEAAAEFQIVHTVSNETVNGTQDTLQWLKDMRVPVVCDMSSDILSRPVDFSRITVAYAGTQKNLGMAASLALVVAHTEFLASGLRESCPYLPPPQNYLEQLKTKSLGALRNTPNVFGLYCVSLMLEWVEREGGVAAMQLHSIRRAHRIYDALDASDVFEPIARHEWRSLMNVTFRLQSRYQEQFEQFLAMAEEMDICGIRGHRGANRLYGNHCRASFYNASTDDDACRLLEAFRRFERMQ